jgi:hypothetical protein
VTVSALIRHRKAVLDDRFDAIAELVEVGEATPFDLDGVLNELGFLSQLAHARLAELEKLFPPDP